MENQKNLEKKIPNPQYRTAEIDTTTNTENSWDLKFSTEEPVDRWYGKEILLHGKANVNLDRLRATGSLLFNHNPDKVIGRIDDVSLKSRTLHCSATFDSDEESQKIEQKVKGKSIKGLSFGYFIDLARRVLEGEKWSYKEGKEEKTITGPAVIGLKWTPFEVTVTPIPLDYNTEITAKTLTFPDIQWENEKSVKTEVSQTMDKPDENKIEGNPPESGKTPETPPIPEKKSINPEDLEAVLRQCEATKDFNCLVMAVKCLIAGETPLQIGAKLIAELSKKREAASPPNSPSDNAKSVDITEETIKQAIK